MNLFTRGASSRRPAPPTAPQRAADSPSHPSGGLPNPALAALTGDWMIDPAHSRIGFSVRHALVTTVRGAFTEYQK